MKAFRAPIKINFPTSLERPITEICFFKDERIEALIKTTKSFKFFAIYEEISPLHHERGLPHVEGFRVFVFSDPETPPLPLSDLHPIKILSRAVLNPVDRHSEGVSASEVLMEGTEKSLRKLHIGVEEKENVASGETGRPVTSAREAQILRVLFDTRESSTEIVEYSHALIF